MNKVIEREGRTVEDAIAEGLKDLNAAREDVEVEVLDKGAKSVLGLFGGKPARVRLTLHVEDKLETTAKFLTRVTELMGCPAKVEAEAREEGVHMELSGETMNALIGSRGETLDALQYLTSIVLNKGSDEYTRITLDTENYRAKREQSLVRLAEKLAQKAYRTRRRVVLEPMTPYERRIIHSALQNNPSATTHSEGEDGDRHIVVDPR